MNTYCPSDRSHEAGPSTLRLAYASPKTFTPGFYSHRTNGVLPTVASSAKLRRVSQWSPSTIGSLDRIDVLGGLTPAREHIGHTGCVNALAWSSDGSTLASGSDDKTVCLWRLGTDAAHPRAEHVHRKPPNTRSGPQSRRTGGIWGVNSGIGVAGDNLLDELNEEIAEAKAAEQWPAPDLGFGLSGVVETGHRANIFSVKFAPTLPSRLFTAAGDSEMRVFDLAQSDAKILSHAITKRQYEHDNREVMVWPRGGGVCTRVLRCHSARVKRISTENSPDVFLSCAEDGEVRQTDLRVNHTCSERGRSSSQSFALSSSTCPSPLVRHSMELYSLSVSKVEPWLFVVAGTSAHAYLHDRRMLPRLLKREWGESTPEPERDALTQCVRRFGRPQRQWDSGEPVKSAFGRAHITAAKIEESTGRELLLSYSDTDSTIYRFNLYDEPEEMHHPEASQWVVREQERNRASEVRTSTQKIHSSGTLDDNHTVERFRRLVAAKKALPLPRNIRSAIVGLLFPRRTLSEGRQAEATAYVERYKAMQHDSSETLPLCVCETLLLFQRLDEPAATETFVQGRSRYLETAVRAKELLQNARSSDDDGEDQDEDDVEPGMDVSNNLLLLLEGLVDDDKARNTPDIPTFHKFLEVLFDEAESVLRAFWGSKCFEFTDRMRLSGQSDLSSDEDPSISTVAPQAAEQSWQWTSNSGQSHAPHAFGSNPSQHQSRQQIWNRADSWEDPPEDGVASWREAVPRPEIRGESDVQPRTGPAFATWDGPDEDEDLHEELARPPAFPFAEAHLNLAHLTRSRNLLPSAVDEGDDANEFFAEFEQRDDDDEVESTAYGGNGGLDDDDEDMEDGDSDMLDMYEEQEEEDEDGDSLVFPTRPVSDSSKFDEAPMVYPRARYQGHINRETVKDVNFVGPYIASGSDDGRLYLYDPASTQLKAVICGDSHVVNVMVPHPTLPVIAVSGIDDEIKLISATSYANGVDGGVYRESREHVEGLAEANEAETEGRSGSYPGGLLAMLGGHLRQINADGEAVEGDCGVM
ncbi:WD40 repeat-like protein [Ceraceosorus guamensis]|uniref:WD40 repeat-like protein n=1 Tax=Ceraceosorus guamensis TaxID=1522189 RepID=A0A316W3I9_9BASI|nr:WD40 repeat-like protein [Ceraceosorus guamensis]PWN43171.1 WD40 repeat-like protein [Ceraceosorus guamensis]